MIKRFAMQVLAGCVLLLAGCAGLTIPADPTHMTAEQLKAVATDRNANVACTVVNSPYGRGIATYVVLDRAVIITGTVQVDSECKVTINSTGVQTAAPIAPALGVPVVSPMDRLR